MRDAAILSLTKLYDRSSGALSLARWLREMQQSSFRQLVLERHQSHFDLVMCENFDSDLRSVTVGDSAVDTIWAFRSKRFAHSSTEAFIADGREETTYLITYGEIDILIERAKTIYNRYMGAAFSHNMSFEAPGHYEPEAAVEAMVEYVAERTYRNNLGMIREIMDYHGFD